MALCYKCNRIMSANGSCLYCGTTSGAASVEEPGRPVRRANWIRRILLLALLALAVHFFVFTPPGRNLIQPLIKKVGLIPPDAPPEEIP